MEEQLAQLGLFAAMIRAALPGGVPPDVDLRVLLRTGPGAFRFSQEPGHRRGRREGVRVYALGDHAFQLDAQSSDIFNDTSEWRNRGHYL